ncbi:MAG: ATP-binding protein, partial [bacterium]
FSTKSEGMGLGLAIVKGILQSMNGSITFKSDPEKGTTFVIGLPVYTE